MDNRGFSRSTLSLCCLIGLGLIPNGLVAQGAGPDTGAVLQQLPQPPLQPLPERDPLQLEAPPLTEGAPGGEQIVLSGVVLAGNTVFSDAVLLEVVGDVEGVAFDMAGLRRLTHRISEFYRAQGYPFARAYLPAQELSEPALLRIHVLEGRYGAVLARGPEVLARGAQPFADVLQSGEVIEENRLERTVLLLGDLPGMRAVPIMRPGAAHGEGDLTIRMIEESRFSGELGFDNHGNRYTGEHRGHAELRGSRLFVFGDEWIIRGMYTDEAMWFGRAAWSRPLGVDGLRGQVSYARTEYSLGKELSNLDFTGVADIYGLGVTYPLRRSQIHNLMLSATWQHKVLTNSFGGDSSRKRSDTLPVSLQFDRRDELGGGGILFGSATWTPGRLSLPASDADSLNTSGHFHKLNLDIARIQRAGRHLTLYGRLSGQWSARNLDSSEGFSLGGASGVRAFPQGEGSGDRGWLFQGELRHNAGAWSPYLFYDAGEVRVNARPTVQSGDPRRRIAGAGIGLRFNHADWSIDAVTAWRTQGGVAESDTRDRHPRFWLSATWRFNSSVPSQPAPTQPAQSEPVVTSAAAEPSPEALAAARQAVIQREIEALLTQWVTAWSNQQVDDYLALYADSFEPADGLSREAWARQRHQRIAAPTYIQLRLSALEMEILGEDRVMVRFDQAYQSDRHVSEVRKALQLHYLNGQWLIERESVL